jgi:hypothetical protein
VEAISNDRESFQAGRSSKSYRNFTDRPIG